MAPPGGPGADGIGVDDHRLLGREERAGAQHRPRPGRVLGGDEVGMGAGGAIARQLEHPAAKRGEHDRQRLGRRRGRVLHASMASR